MAHLPIDLRTIGIILVSLLLITLGWGYIKDPSNPPLITSRHYTTCNVQIGNLLFFDPYIAEYSCSTGRDCSLDILSIWDPLGDYGVAKVTIGSKVMTADYSVGEFDTTSVQVGGCVPDGTYNDALIELIGDDEAIKDSTTFSITIP